MYKSVFGAVLILLSIPAYAVSLSPGETVSLSGTTAVLSPETAGPILEEQISIFSIEIDGTMVTGEVSQRLRNFQEFGLLVEYSITSFDDQGLGLEIQGLNTQDIFLVGEIGPLDVDYRLDEPGDVAPETASLQAGFGGPVEFDFGSDPLLAGETSLWMFVGDPNNDLVGFGRLNAHLLVTDMSGAQFSIPFDSYFTWVPVPGAIWLFSSGLIGLIGLARRKS